MRTNRIQQIHGLRNDTRALGLSTSKHGLIHAAASPLYITPSHIPNDIPIFILVSIMSTTEQPWSEREIRALNCFISHLETLDPNERTVIVDPFWLPTFDQLVVSLISPGRQRDSFNLNLRRDRSSRFSPSNTRHGFEGGS